jgi:hypothetical protein
MYKSLLAAAIFAALPGAVARAEVFDWSYTGVFTSGPDVGALVSGNGQFTATPTATPGVFSVNGISGTADGSSITGLTSYAAQDQLLYYQNGFANFLDFPGIAFEVAGDQAFNFYFLASSSGTPGGNYDCGAAGYCMIGPGTPGTSGLGPPADAYATIEFTATAAAVVPEPSTWVMMLVGFAGLGFAGYRRAREPRAA